MSTGPSKTIDLTPTVAGVRHMRRVFLETIERSKEVVGNAEALIERVTASQDGGRGLRFTDTESDTLLTALEALCSEEWKRQESMAAGIAECDKDTREGADGGGL